MLPQQYTIKKAADYLIMGESTLRKLIAEGKIGHYKRPGKITISEEHIKNYLKTHCS